MFQPDRFEDQRGSFVKTYHRDVWARFGIEFQMAEEFYSTSRKGVIRGMHFQAPPHAHDKMVFCLSGGVRDVLLDLRPGPNYGRVVECSLTAENRRILFIPAGIAHGFQATEDDSLLVYKTSTVHSPQSDSGIRFDSFEFDWGRGEQIISLRDKSHPTLAEHDRHMFGNS